MASNVEEHIIRLRDEMSKGLQNINREVTKTRKHLDKMAGQSDKTANGIRSLNRAMAGLLTVQTIKGFINLNRTLFNTSVQFENLSNKINFAMGSVDAGERGFKFASNLANTLGLNLRETISGFTDLQAASIGTAFTQTQVANIFESVSKAATVLHLDTQRTSQVFLALEQMMSKGTVSMEELRRQLGNSLPGALSIAARSMNMTQSEFAKLVEDGQIMAQDLLPRLAEELDKTFGSGLSAAMESSQAKVTRLANAFDQMKKSFGDLSKPLVIKLIEGTTDAIETLTPGSQANIELQKRNLFANPFGGNFFGEFAKLQKETNQLLKGEELDKSFMAMQKRLDAALAKVDPDDADAVKKVTDRFLIDSFKLIGGLDKQVRELSKDVVDQAQALKERSELVDNARARDKGDFATALTPAAQELAFYSESVAKLKGESAGLKKFSEEMDKLVGDILDARRIGKKNKEVQELKNAGKGKGKNKFKDRISTIEQRTPKIVNVNIGSLIGQNVNNLDKPEDQTDMKKLEKMMTNMLAKVINDSQTVNEK